MPTALAGTPITPAGAPIALAGTPITLAGAPIALAGASIVVAAGRGIGLVAPVARPGAPIAPAGRPSIGLVASSVSVAPPTGLLEPTAIDDAALIARGVAQLSSPRATGACAGVPSMDSERVSR